MPADTASVAEPKPTHRSAVTNGSRAVADADGRSAWVRRFKDVVAAHISDLGGRAEISEAEFSIVKRAATLTVQLEQMEAAFATGEAAPGALDAYQRGSNTLRRLLEALGLQRRPKDVTPTLSQYLDGRRPAGGSE